ncbi:PREDICTED: membrane-spanning 4-domains subfamily A member 7 isoform X2 [Hipposideros armiger]|uniref:Membrane-spanning 4-domains subfamily A member 7 isoform X2 n=1 Tax=Hipposideros armiger TaxID=186990 RepID=A0A8B7SG19_HIPAR|nr:PREDICTED: membrane-spanning 4-domains subfamily A member 7 isoform X2 [Hipposideros armiger]
MVSIMSSQPTTKKAFHCSTLKGILIPQGEKPGHIYQNENKPQNGLQKEATILGFAITGSLSIIAGKKSTKPFAMSSLTSSTVSFVAAGAGLSLLTTSMVALGTATEMCDSENEDLSSLLYLEYYYSIQNVKDCFLTYVSLMGVMVVMLIFTVLEILLAAYASVFWWKQVYSNNPGSAFSLPQSQDHIQHIKKFFKVMDMSNSWF